MKKILLLFPLLLIVLLSSNPLSAGQQADVSMYILNLGKFDISTGSFTADFYLSMKCKDECSPEKFEFMNGRATSTDKIIDKPNEKFYRIQANLNSPVNLKKFPFDTQKMEIILEDKENTVEDLHYNPVISESGIDESIVFTGWNIDSWSAEKKEHFYPIYNETYSQYVFTINISKIALNSFIKTILPIIFIVLIVLFSFIIDPDKITQRLTMAGSSLIASVMFHVSLTNQIPSTGYLTFADKFMILTYFILLVTFIINIILLDLQERKKTDLMEKIHKKTEYSMLIVVPILYIILILFFL